MRTKWEDFRESAWWSIWWSYKPKEPLRVFISALQDLMHIQCSRKVCLGNWTKAQGPGGDSPGPYYRRALRQPCFTTAMLYGSHWPWRWRNSMLWKVIVYQACVQILMETCMGSHVSNKGSFLLWHIPKVKALVWAWLRTGWHPKVEIHKEIFISSHWKTCWTRGEILENICPLLMPLWGIQKAICVVLQPRWVLEMWWWWPHPQSP